MNSLQQLREVRLRGLKNPVEAEEFVRAPGVDQVHPAKLLQSRCVSTAIGAAEPVAAPAT